MLWDPIEAGEEGYAELPEGVVALEVRGSSMEPVAYAGQSVLAVPETPRNGDLVAVELRDGRQFFKRWWWRKGRTTAELLSVSPVQIAPPIPIRRRDIRKAWRVIGVLF